MSKKKQVRETTRSSARAKVSAKEEEKTFHEKIIVSIIDFVKAHKIKLIVALVSIIVVTVFSVGFVVYYDIHEKNTLNTYQKIMKDYEQMIQKAQEDGMAAANEDSDESDLEAGMKKSEEAFKSASKTTADKILALSEKSRWGYVKRYGNYLAGGLFYRAEDYTKAKDNYDVFIKNNRSNELVPLAMLQIAICNEWLGDFDSAFTTYKLMEQDFQESGFSDQILYSLARVYQKQGNIEKSKEYLSRLIAEHPASSFVKKSKTRLMLLGYKQGGK